MRENIKKKKLLVNEISNLLKNANIIFVIKYAGIKSLDLKILRSSCAIKNIKIKIMKNSLAKKVLLNIGYDTLNDSLTEQVLMLFSEDIFSAISMLETIKNDYNLTVKSFSIEKKIVSKDVLNELLVLGSKENIILRLILLLQNPLSRFINILKLPILNFSYLIKTIEYKKRGM